MLALLFPGQGSQRKGMGSELFDSIPLYAELEFQINSLLGYSLRELCLLNPDNRLTDTRYTQPALYVVNALHWQKACIDGLRPHALAGHSLGEYNALLAAGAFDFMTGLRLVQKRGELMGQARNGAMTAVLQLDALKIASTLQQHGFASIDIANYNSPTQTVISGPADDLKRAHPLLEKAGATTCAPLQVSAAFHSRYMADAANSFEDFLQGFEFKSLQTKVVANVTGRAYPSSDPTATIRSMLTRQVTESVKWTQSIRHLADTGISEFKETGPGNVLTRVLDTILAQH